MDLKNQFGRYIRSVTALFTGFAVVFALAMMLTRPSQILAQSSLNGTDPTEEPTATPASALLTIRKDAVPDDPENFVYYGPFGEIKLDDASPDDTDVYTNTFSMVIPPGNYNISEGILFNWNLTAVNCTPSLGATVNLTDTTVNLTINGGDDMVCVFVNQQLPTPTATPIESPTVTDTPTNTPLPTDTPLPTNTPLPSDTPTNTPIPSDTPTDVPTATGTYTPVPSATPSDTPTDLPTATQTNTPIPSDTPVPSDTPTNVPTATGTITGTITGTPIPSNTPTDAPTATETNTAIPSNTPLPSDTPTDAPTATGTATTTAIPSATYTTTPIATPPSPTASNTPSTTGTNTPTATDTAVVPTSTPGSTTIAPTATATSTRAKLIIQLEAQPNSIQNFGFASPFGAFTLDDAGTSDSDSFTNTITYSVEPGTYTFSEVLPTLWHLSAINCTGSTNSGSTTVNLSQRLVTIRVAAGETVMCTFVNQRRVNLQAKKYNDLNGDGLRQSSEPFMNDWEIKLYSLAGTPLITKTIDLSGIAEFALRPPGAYKVCETQQTGWSHTTTGPLDVALNQPCYTVLMTPGNSATILFGNRQGPATGNGEVEPRNIEFFPLEDTDDPNTENPDTIVSTKRVYLPVISR